MLTHAWRGRYHNRDMLLMSKTVEKPIYLFFLRKTEVQYSVEQFNIIQEHVGKSADSLLFFFISTLNSSSGDKSLSSLLH